MPDISSPCIRNCCLDEDDICIGCSRSIEEILQWGDAGNEQKLQILIKAKARKNERQSRYRSCLNSGNKG
jgi:predicted Fe-S protein YdhL (DUF1289 family)